MRSTLDWCNRRHSITVDADFADFLYVLTVLTVKQVRVCASIDSFVTVTCHVKQKWLGKTGDLWGP